MSGTGGGAVAKGALFLPACCCLSFPLLAQESSISGKGAVYVGEFEEMVVTEFGDPLSRTTVTGSIDGIGRMDSTRSVGVLDDSEISVGGADRVEDLLPYLPGVALSTSYAGYSTTFSVRGFSNFRSVYGTGDLFFNGQRDNGRMFVRDLATIERVELLRGHGSVLYGSGTPAATLNYISRRPAADPATLLSLTSGERGFVRAVLDSTGPLGSSGRLLYRLVAAAQDGRHTIYDNVEYGRWTLFPSLLWNYSADGSLRLELEYSRNHQPYYFGTVRVGDEILYDHSYVLPEAGSDRRHGRLGLYWNQRLGEHAELRISASHFTTRRDDTVAGFYSKIDDTKLAGYYRLVDEDYRQDGVKVELGGLLHTGPVEHRLLFGLEHNDDRGKVESLKNVGGFLLNPRDPDLEIDLSALPLAPNDYITDNREGGIYLFDRMALTPSLSLELGARYSEFEAGIESLTRKVKSDRTDQRSWSTTAGMVWRPSGSGSWYLNLSDSFKPNWGTDRNQQFFDPMQTRQAEAGLRYRLADGSWNIESAIYRIEQKNLLKKDPKDPEYLVLAGERHSQGAELSLQYIHSPLLRLTAAYSYIDARYVGEESRNRDKVPASIPERSGSLRIDYFPPAAPAWRLFGGAIAVGERFGDDANSFEIPAYTRLDLGLQYAIEGVRATLSVRNATDERYIVAASSESNIYQGNRRTVRLTVEWGQ